MNKDSSSVTSTGTVKCKWCPWTREMWKRSKHNQRKPRPAYQVLFDHVRERHPERIAELEAVHGRFGNGCYGANASSLEFYKRRLLSQD